MPRGADAEAPGGQAGHPRIQAWLRATGEAEGIRFAFEGKVGNTRDSHRLVQLAKTKPGDMQDRVVASLFQIYFEENGDVTDPETLVAAGVRGGLDAGEIRAWMEAGQGGDQVDEEVQWAYAQGVYSVPSFTINDRSRIEGAQDVPAFLAGLAKAKEDA